MIGNRISDARKSKNISQAQLAETLFISAQAVGKWERGESLPDILMLNKIAQLFEVDLNYFVGMKSTLEPVNHDVESITDKPAKKTNWNMSEGNWVDADFSGLKNLHDKFSSSNMKNCKFVGSDLSGIQLSSNNVKGCDFSVSEFKNSKISSSNLVDNKFKGCELAESTFSESNISGCDFSDSDLSDSNFNAVSFTKNKVHSSIWKRTSFTATHLGDIVFNGEFNDCSFDNCSFRNVTFQNATLLNCFFKGRSLKRIKFENCRMDRMTFEFLKNGKADLSGVSLY